ncbi:MAG: hypothetical protein B0A82_24755 [Alkalinema sp. CACIAM 70d]|nr:MAG: hypothetical protein B0A82_24755 [Alkalinema sp. CACIAM 70d]
MKASTVLISLLGTFALSFASKPAVGQTQATDRPLGSQSEATTASPVSLEEAQATWGSSNPADLLAPDSDDAAPPALELSGELSGEPASLFALSPAEQPLAEQAGETLAQSPPLDPPTATPSSSPTAPAIPTVLPPSQIQLTPSSDSRIPADGRSRVSLTGRILDANGTLISQDALVTLTTTAGKFIGADYDTDLAGFQVMARNGEFSVDLQANLIPQRVRIRAGLDQVIQPQQNANIPAAKFSLPPSTPVEVYTSVEFITNLRPALVSGTLNLRIGAAGTNYYGSFRDFLRDDLTGTAVEANAAVFAIGTVGDWLFTGAYNSQRNLNETCSGTTSLFRADQFCDQVYPVYGDSSTVDFLTPSIDSVFLKFERTSPVPDAGSDYFMWGDYKTDEFARPSQLFTATQRSLHGFKGNYNLGNLQATLMYGNNLQGFQRDTIAPNGTSGYYFLSRRLVLAGSENVFIETEELNRPGTVVKRLNLSRNRDYEIDYDRGALIFRKPVLQTEADLFGQTLVRRIVVTYQYDGGDNDTKLYAGRLQYNLARGLGQESWLATSYLREDLGGQDFELYGADAQISLGKSSRIVAEFARSNNNSPFGYVSGTAYRVEAIAQFSPDIAARAYYKSVDEGFANNATFSFAPGQTRYGAEFAAKVSDSTQFQARVDREINYGIATQVRTVFESLFEPGVQAPPGSPVDNSLTTISAGVAQKFGTASLSLDWVNRTREDRIANRLTEDSNQLVSRFTYPITDTLLFRVQNELSLGGQRDPLYPDRTTVGLDWKAFPGVTLRVAQQFLSGGDFARNSLTTFETLVDQKLSEDTTLTGRYSVLNGINGWSSQGAIGLQHQFKLSPGLRMNLAYERIFGDIFTYTGTGQQYAQPYAVGQNAASLGVTSGDSYSIGFEYTDNPNFKASARFEKRNSSEGNNMVISAAAVGKVSPALTVLGRFQQANYANQTIVGLGDTKNLKLGLAYRDPNDDRFNALLRYEYRENPDISPSTLLFGVGSGSKVHLGAVELIYAPSFRWEFYSKFALRSTTSYLARDLVGKNTTTLTQFRAGYKLGYNWDLVGEVRWIHQTQTSSDELGFLLEAGYYITPNLRVAAGYSFGRTDDIDFDGSRSRGGPYVALSVKLNDLFGFGRQRIAPKQQQESVITQKPNPPLSVSEASFSPAIAPSPPTLSSPLPQTLSQPSPDLLSQLTAKPKSGEIKLFNGLTRMEKLLAEGAQ